MLLYPQQPKGGDKMNYETFKQEVIQWAVEKGIKYEDGMGKWEIICLLFNKGDNILLYKNHDTDHDEYEPFVEFRVGDTNKGFDHFANIKSIRELEENLWTYHPKLLQGNL